MAGNKKIHPDYRVNYQETFTLVAKPHTVRVLLSLAANQEWQLHKLDVKNSFCGNMGLWFVIKCQD